MKVKTILILVSMAIMTTAPGATSLSRRAFDCVQVEANSPGALCMGQRSALRVDVENRCLTPKRIALAFVLDQSAVRPMAVFVVPGEATLSKAVLWTFPSTMTPGTHVLTILATHAAGEVASTDLAIAVESCTGS